MSLRGAFTAWLPQRAGAELAAVTRFRQAWAQTQAVDRVTQALGRKPDKAGPLNSHALVLQALASLQDASPRYLRRSVEFIETLDWLERAGQQPAPRKPPKSAAARRR
jgi:hypothetical protein